MSNIFLGQALGPCLWHPLSVRRSTFLLLLLTIASRAAAGDLDTLRQEVRAIGIPGVPGPLIVCGEHAFPVVSARSGGQPVVLVAAGRIGKGRVVAFGHEGYLGEVLAEADTARLLANAARWCGGRRVGVRGHPRALRALRDAGLVAEESRDPAGFDLFVADCHRLAPQEIPVIVEHVRRGGGLITAGLGWGWQQLNPDKELAADHPGNALLAEAGIYFADGAIDLPDDRRIAVTEMPADLHALEALRVLERGDKSSLAVATLTRATAGLPPFDRNLLPRIERLARRRRDEAALPGAQRPLDGSAGLARVLLAFDLARERRLPPDEVRAHPAAADFPGAVAKSARRLSRTLRVDARVPGWHSTGLYAAPGDVVTVSVPAAAARLGWKLRIGAHTDRLWDLAEWRRAPDIARVFPISAEVTRAASAFGGLLYIDVGRSEAAHDVAISGAVEAPWFVLGETEAAEWARRRKNAQAPWGEFGTGKVILTLPSEALRAVADPAALLEFWDRVLDACADLAAIPRERERPERYAADVQISAGYMHSGYPIMTHLDAVPRFVDLNLLLTRGDWGMFHEMGHNHQQPDWTFEGTGEVTCNLFTLYVMETVCRKPSGHEAMAPEERGRKKKAHLEAGADFARWKADPFLALIPYAEMRDAFGWEAYRKVFAEYRALREEERPKSDADKRDQWMVRFSRAVGRDLGPFFAKWGIPVSESARKSVAGLPAWE